MGCTSSFGELEGVRGNAMSRVSYHLPTALLAGATKAEAAATRRAKRKRERILLLLIR